VTGIDIYAVADGKVTGWWGEVNLSELFNMPEGDRSASDGFGWGPSWRGDRHSAVSLVRVWRSASGRAR